MSPENEEEKKIPVWVPHAARFLSGLVFTVMALMILGLVIMAFKFVIWAWNWIPV